MPPDVSSITIRMDQGRDHNATVQHIQAALKANQIGTAIDVAEAALVDGMEHPLVLNLAAYRRQVDGRLGEATALLERACKIAPTDVVILSALGGCLSQQGLETQSPTRNSR